MMEALSARRTLADCTVGLGITGSIAAYKSAEIVRLLTGMGIDVRVIMTDAATRLISPDTLSALSGNPVAVHLFPPESGTSPRMEHLDIGREVDAMLIAPASADVLGKIASGIADDLLSTAIMASAVPVIFAPAMNRRMWENPIVQRNVALLREAGYQFSGPETGDLACGETGAGRMVSAAKAADGVIKLLLEQLQGLHVVVTAGPTEEPVDPVRVLSNRSSGRMGVRLAEAARDRGHRVTLVAGPLSCPPPIGVGRIDVRTAREMQQAVHEVERHAEILIMAAAVADYRPAEPQEQKIRSGAESLQIRLTPNPDILAGVAAGRAERGVITLGFALEVGEGGEIRAESKLKAKHLDMIVLNDATQPDSAFGGETIRPTLLFADGRIERLAAMTKRDAAQAILAGAEGLFGLRAAGGGMAP
ncbi:MAG: bifunctional phosphopantothenoylcysteine decarboxylase/phosphopantothenate--cysteine ligase CoaBC [Candidatus Eisenbacteria bacterium]